MNQLYNVLILDMPGNQNASLVTVCFRATVLPTQTEDESSLSLLLSKSRDW